METLLQGLVLLVSGMGIVYLFLTLLVWVVNRSAAIVPKFNYILPDEEPKKKKSPVQARTQVSGQEDLAVAVALAAAVARAR